MATIKKLKAANGRRSVQDLENRARSKATQIIRNRKGKKSEVSKLQQSIETHWKNNRTIDRTFVVDNKKQVIVYIPKKKSPGAFGNAGERHIVIQE